VSCYITAIMTLNFVTDVACPFGDSIPTCNVEVKRIFLSVVKLGPIALLDMVLIYFEH
jgi:hypothetical protein